MAVWKDGLRKLKHWGRWIGTQFEKISGYNLRLLILYVYKSTPPHPRIVFYSTKFKRIHLLVICISVSRLLLLLLMVGGSILIMCTCASLDCSPTLTLDFYTSQPTQFWHASWLFPELRGLACSFL